jgi:hypothetical protein
MEIRITDYFNLDDIREQLELSNCIILVLFYYQSGNKSIVKLLILGMVHVPRDV